MEQGCFAHIYGLYKTTQPKMDTDAVSNAEVNGQCELHCKTNNFFIKLFFLVYHRKIEIQ